MSLIESAPQKQKHFDNRKQDHGDAAQYTEDAHPQNSWYAELQRQSKEKSAKDQFKDAILDAFETMTPAELEREANALLGEDPVNTLDGMSFETAKGSHDESFDEEELEARRIADPFATESEYGVKSRSEIRNALARRATLDAELDNDDHGDDDFDSPIRIKTRL
jgi:hypothetical protein